MLAHLCRECGTDLAAVRAAREPRYDLMIVRCPTCASVTARGRSPVLRRWRQLRRLDWALTVLAANLVLLVVLLIATVGPIVWLTAESLSSTPAEIWKRDAEEMLLTLAIFPLLTGTWLTVGLVHWRRPAAFLTFAALAAGVLVFITAVRIAEHAERAATDPQWLAGPLLQLRLEIALLVLVMIVAALGVLPGMGVRRLLAAGRRAQWRWRRRRGRRERG